jgi:hypothetical protein
MEGGLRNKAIVRMECATHFAVWEASQYKFMQEASLEWLNDGPILEENGDRFILKRMGTDLFLQSRLH